MGLFARIEKIFHGKGQHCHFPMTVHDRFGDSHGPNGHAPRTGNKPRGHNSPTQYSTQLDLLCILCHHHLSSYHRSSLLVFLHIHPDLISIGLAPDFDSLGPCQIDLSL